MPLNIQTQFIKSASTVQTHPNISQMNPNKYQLAKGVRIRTSLSEAAQNIC